MSVASYFLFLHVVFWRKLKKFFGSTVISFLKSNNFTCIWANEDADAFIIWTAIAATVHDKTVIVVGHDVDY